MPDLDLGGSNVGFVDKRNGRGLTGASNLVELANYASVSTLKARLAALSASSYTAARLAQMTDNDCVYALRVASADVAGI